MLNMSKIEDSSALKSSFDMQNFPPYLFALLKGFLVINLHHISMHFHILN